MSLRRVVVTANAFSPVTLVAALPSLSAICHAVGKMQVDDSEQLHLIPLIADVKVQPPKNGYGETNKIRYQPLEGAAPAPEPVHPAAPPPKSAPPPQSRPSEGNFTTAPWKRST